MAEWGPELILNQWKDTVSALEENTRPMSWRDLEEMRADFRQSKGLVDMQLSNGDPANREEIIREFESLEETLEASIARSISIHGEPKKPGLGRIMGFIKGLLYPLRKMLP